MAVTAGPRPASANDDARGRPAVFLDKDGTLVENVPYNVDPALLRLTRGAATALRLLADAGYLLFVVSNQPGIALGRFDSAALARLLEALELRLRERGIRLAGFYACPHAPVPVGAAPGCECRKPAPGLLQRAAAEHGIDLSRSWMVGDILDDVEAGRRAGCRTVLLDVGNETVWRGGPLREPHRRAANLLDAARLMLAASDASHSVRA